MNFIYLFLHLTNQVYLLSYLLRAEMIYFLVQAQHLFSRNINNLIEGVMIDFFLKVNLNNICFKRLHFSLLLVLVFCYIFHTFRELYIQLVLFYSWIASFFNVIFCTLRCL